MPWQEIYPLILPILLHRASPIHDGGVLTDMLSDDNNLPTATCTHKQQKDYCKQQYTLNFGCLRRNSIP